LNRTAVTESVRTAELHGSLDDRSGTTGCQHTLCSITSNPN
jgi:hypothetical protein